MTALGFDLRECNNFTFFDRVTTETILPLMPVLFEDDFVGPASKAFPIAPAAGTFWGKKLVSTLGAPSVSAQNNAGCGIVLLSIDATNEKQDAALYWLDYVGIDASKQGGMELLFSVPAVPGPGTEIVLGMQSAWVDGPDNATAYVRLALRGSGAVFFETWDGITRTSTPTGITLAPGAWHRVKVSWYKPNTLLCWIDGTSVLGNAQIGFAAVSPLSVMQPYCSCYKSAGVGTASLALDYFKAWSGR